jgi:hypothetical protein
LSIKYLEEPYFIFWKSLTENPLRGRVEEEAMVFAQRLEEKDSPKKRCRNCGGAMAKRPLYSDGETPAQSAIARS